MAIHNEIEFENEICELLGSNGWLNSPTDGASLVWGFAGSNGTLQECRDALISAAVTGKIIDVTECAP